MENVVYDVGQSAGRCGYCDVSNDFYTHGMVAQSSMTVNVYQDLLDLGWRRSGTYLYKPDLRRMCCPTYTIRLNVNDFVPSKAQKRTMRRWEQYLDGGALAQRYQPEKTATVSGPISHDTMPALMKLLLTDMLDAWFSSEEVAKVSVDVTVGRPSTKQRKTLTETAFLSSPMCIALFHALKAQLKTQMRWGAPADLAQSFVSHFEGNKERLWRDRLPKAQQPIWMRFVQELSVHSTKGYLNFHLPKQEHLPEQETITQWLQSLQASDPREPLSSQLTDAIEVSDASETVDSEMTSLPSSFCRPSQKRHLVLSIAPSSFVEEEYQLYKKYQTQVHGDSPDRFSRRQYTGFLIDTPLIGVPSAEGRPEMGSFHMQYRIDDHLVAVGVVDILPRCLSSKYFFWDPDFAPLALGKVSALMEIEWVQKAARSYPDLQYYYMGYYIQSCPKMRYKGDYEPSELLCPESHHWVCLTDDIRKELQDNAYRHLSGIPGAVIQQNATVSLPPLSDVRMQRVCAFANGMTFEAYLQLIDNRWQQRQRRSWLEWRSPDGVSRMKEIADLLTPILERWRSQTGRVANALVYNCAALESIAFSSHEDPDDDDDD